MDKYTKTEAFLAKSTYSEAIKRRAEVSEDIKTLTALRSKRRDEKEDVSSLQECFAHLFRAAEILDGIIYEYREKS